MKTQEIESIIERHTIIGDTPINTYMHLLSYEDFNLNEMEFIALACRFFNRNENMHHLCQKWISDMAYCMSHSMDVGLIFGFKDNTEQKYLIYVNDCSVEFAKDTKEYRIYAETHQEVLASQYIVDKISIQDIPTGEVVYRKSDDTYVFYCDTCLISFVQSIISTYGEYDKKIELHIGERFERPV